MENNYPFVLPGEGVSVSDCALVDCIQAGEPAVVSHPLHELNVTTKRFFKKKGKKVEH